MKYLLLINSIFFLSCNSKVNDQKNGNNNYEITKQFKNPSSLMTYQSIVITDLKMEWVFGKGYKNQKPSIKDIELAETFLQEAFNIYEKDTMNRAKKLPDYVSTPLSSYYRQFVGAINTEGDYIIWINCFCKEEVNKFPNWKTKLALMEGGGDCFFNLKVNMTKKAWYDFEVNSLK